MHTHGGTARLMLTGSDKHSRILIAARIVASLANCDICLSTRPGLCLEVGFDECEVGRSSVRISTAALRRASKILVFSIA
jgi:hypothetical protein